MQKLFTQEQIQKKYKGKYVEVYRTLDWKTGEAMFEIRKVSKFIRENMTLGEDVGTSMAYRR